MSTATVQSVARPALDPIRLIGFSVENMGCLRVFNLEPTDSIVELHGANGVGKSTVLDAFTWALVGDRALPESPVRKGAEKATVIVKTDKYTIQRTATAKGTTSLKLTDANGAAVARPQETLAALWSDMAPDPLKFMDLSPAEQGKIIAKGCGLTDRLEAIAAKHKAAYEARTLANRDRDQQAAVLAGFGPVQPGPVVEVSAQDIINQIGEAEEEIRENAGSRRTLAEALSKCAAAKQEVERLTQALAAAQQKVDGLSEWLGNNRADIEALQDPDTSALRTRLQNIEAENAMARRRVQRAETAKKHEAAVAAAVEAQRAVEDIDEERRKAIAGAKMPVEGMVFDELGAVTIDGLPLSKLETSAKIKLGVQIVMATRPRLPIVLIQRGESLDEHSMATLRESLAAADGYALIEVVERKWDASQGIVIVQGATA